MKNSAFCIFMLAAIFFIPVALSARTAEKIDLGAYADASKIQASLSNIDGDDSINKKLTECLQSGSDTASAAVCYDGAYESYETLLNKIYLAALNSIDDASSRTQLEMSQNAWSAFRDQEFGMYKLGWKRKMGTVAGTTISLRKIGMVRERISELTLYLGIDER